MTLNSLSNSKFCFDFTEGLFYKSKINSRDVYVVKTKTWPEGFSMSKNRIYNTVASHVDSRESNNPNTYNSDNFIGNPNIPCINVHTKISSN